MSSELKIVSSVFDKDNNEVVRSESDEVVVLTIYRAKDTTLTVAHIAHWYWTYVGTDQLNREHAVYEGVK